MRSSRGIGVLLLALAATPGCAGPEDPAGRSVEDATETQVIEASIGGSYDLQVEPAAVVGDKAAVKVLAFSVTAGESFAAVMRRADDSDLDPWLALYVDGESVAVSDWDQGAAPMAEASDAVIVHSPAQDGEVLLVAADLDLAVRADFQLDLVELETSPTTLAFHATTAATRIMTETLREREPQTLDYLERGMVSEAGDGLLVDHPTMAPSLQERAALAGFVDAVNTERALLFREIVRASTGEELVALEAEAGAVCGALWEGLRDETHALR